MGKNINVRDHQASVGLTSHNSEEESISRPITFNRPCEGRILMTWTESLRLNTLYKSDKSCRDFLNRLFYLLLATTVGSHLGIHLITRT